MIKLANVYNTVSSTFCTMRLKSVVTSFQPSPATYSHAYYDSCCQVLHLIAYLVVCRHHLVKVMKSLVLQGASNVHVFLCMEYVFLFSNQYPDGT